MELVNLAKFPKVRKTFYASAGKKLKKVYKYVYSEELQCPRRVENGFINVDEMIQSYKDDVDFAALGKMLVTNKENVIDHFALNGEIQDVTGLPRNIHEYEALYNKMKEEYEKIPEELKSMFGSFDGFSEAWRSNRIGSMIDTYYKSIQEPAAVASEETGKETE